MIASIVVNYHCAALTARAVMSLLIDLPQGQIVVVDNSTDAVEAAKLKVLLPNKLVKIIITEKNLGFGSACNVGVRATTSDYIMLLNPDAFVVSGCLTHLQKCLDDNPDLGAVSPIQWWDTEGDWLLPPSWLPTGPGMWSIEAAWRNRRWAQRLSMAYRCLALKTWTNTKEHVQQRGLSGGAIMLRRSVIRSNHELFDPAFFMYYEDSDLSLRLRQSGWRLGLVREAAVVHEWENKPTKSVQMEQSKSVFLAKHFAQKNHWQTRMALRISHMPTISNPLDAEEIMHTTTAVSVPKAWQHKWLLEISPSPLLIPAIGHLGSGAKAHLPRHLASRLGSGPMFLRLGPTTYENISKPELITRFVL